MFFKKNASLSPKVDVPESSPEKETLPLIPHHIQDLQKRIRAAAIPSSVRETATQELERLSGMDRFAPEAGIAINYLEFLLSLPWEIVTRDNLDLARAQAILQARHLGLDTVKERVLEFLAVKTLRGTSRPKILVVDDEEIARTNLAYVFEKDGYDVSMAQNGLEAVYYMHKQPADIVITDLKMERMDGIQLLGQIRKQWPDTSVIMITGYATVDTAVTALKEGADHYLSKPVNLTKLRERVRDMMDAKERASHLNGPVLCFTGPPGTGKTSIGRAIAEALERKFVRFSLAGLRDEAELRGHRRTYVGAMAGRILTEIQKAGVRNPVIMLDEMDKIIQDFKGDAASVFLEVLDPEQNAAFVDHYLDIPFDLSSVMFIATANMAENLPAPLLDRMELIEFSSYTLKEKEAIATRFLVPAQLKRHGLNKELITLTDEGIRSLILGYTREAGLRGLEKKIASLCRKLARQRVEQGGSTGGKETLDARGIAALLGSPFYTRTRALTAPRVGLATGLVWTETGGEIIFVEVARMKGNKQLILTGSLGDVLRESAQAALSYLRSNADLYRIDPGFFEVSDIHIHLPSGGVSKDGPSAGITIFVALLSLLTGRAVRQDVALSGEMTLLGDILPVGGVREKVLAASQAGIRKIVFPQKNDLVIKGLGNDVVQGVEIVLADTVRELADIVLVAE
ncbi:MAG: response regulator [Desulfoplanes sp.]|nr:response regulator [Desulfoplanes sp.]